MRQLETCEPYRVFCLRLALEVASHPVVCCAWRCMAISSYSLYYVGSGIEAPRPWIEGPGAVAGLCVLQSCCVHTL